MLKLNYYYHIRYIHRHRGTELLKIFPSKDQLHNPYPFYSTMRRYNPIAFDNKKNICGIFGYHDAKLILSNDNATETNHLVPIVRNSLVSLLTSRLSSRLKTRIEEIAHELLDKVIGQEKMDIMSDLARPLSMLVITELMGLPAEDIHIFERWTSDFTRSLSLSVADYINEDEKKPSTRTKDEKTDVTIKSLQKLGREILNRRLNDEMNDYFHSTIQYRGRSHSYDIIGYFKDHSMDKQQQRTFLTICRNLIIAGQLTTRMLIGNTILSLLENPLELKDLQENPSLIYSAIEESLRYRSPLQVITRRIIKEITISGRTLVPGQKIFIWLGSANRDESFFSEPDRFNIRRDKNEHLSFGFGIRSCPGWALGLMETRIALAVFFKRLKNISLCKDKQQLINLESIFFCGPNNLDLNFN
jgi:cytochrome P450 family 109